MAIVSRPRQKLLRNFTRHGDVHTYDLKKGSLTYEVIDGHITSEVTVSNQYLPLNRP